MGGVLRIDNSTNSLVGGVGIAGDLNVAGNITQANVKRGQFLCGVADTILFSDSHITLQWSSVGLQLQWRINGAGLYSMACNCIKSDGTTVVSGGDFADSSWKFLTNDGSYTSVRDIAANASVLLSCQIFLVPQTTDIPFYKISFFYGKHIYSAGLTVEII